MANPNTITASEAFKKYHPRGEGDSEKPEYAETLWPVKYGNSVLRLVFGGTDLGPISDTTCAAIAAHKAAVARVLIMLEIVDNFGSLEAASPFVRDTYKEAIFQEIETAILCAFCRIMLSPADALAIDRHIAEIRHDPGTLDHLSELPDPLIEMMSDTFIHHKDKDRILKSKAPKAQA